ncbi:MAG: FAD-binding oxidoreductase [Desulfobacteraceae bacterium]|nr:FAD-binding oxidoreductase [Desulfobacteraceae bacterium]
MEQNTYDIIIAGGGIMGCATAYYLMKSDPSLKLAVVEKDPAYERASTTLSMANVRIQFSLEENVRISQYAFEKLETFEEDMVVEDRKPAIAYRREGNLFLFDDKNHAAAAEAYGMQKKLGCDIEWWDSRTIGERYPLYDPSPYGGGTYGAKDGHFDAYAVLAGYKAKAKSLGALFIQDEITTISRSGDIVQGVSLASGEDLSAEIVINCAGAWCSRLAETAGVRLPVQPVSRQVFALDTQVKPDGPLPLTVLPSGLFFRSETGGLILLGKSMTEDPVGFNFSWDDKRFMEVLWPELAEFVPAFEALKLVRGWAGLYAVNTLDSNAILGEWPELKGFYLANGFSGHGLQQAPAVGRYLSELILRNPHKLDLSTFSPNRILDRRPLSEAGLV